MSDKFMFNGELVQINEPNVKIGSNVTIHGDMVKINGRYIQPHIPGALGGPSLVPQVDTVQVGVAQPDVWVNGVNVGNPLGSGSGGNVPPEIGK